MGKCTETDNAASFKEVFQSIVPITVVVWRQKFFKKVVHSIPTKTHFVRFEGKFKNKRNKNSNKFLYDSHFFTNTEGQIRDGFFNRRQGALILLTVHILKKAVSVCISI